MSLIYLMRHGQAGLRHRYDTLSDLGRVQARRLGEYLVGQNVRFDALFTGELSRQQETACEVAGAFQRAGLAVPETQIDGNWNEFDLDMVYKTIAPRLSAEDPEFQAEHEKLLRQLDDDNSPVHRAWTQCDTLVVRAWVEGRYEVPGESWEAFRERVCRALETPETFCIRRHDSRFLVRDTDRRMDWNGLGVERTTHTSSGGRDLQRCAHYHACARGRPRTVQLQRHAAPAGAASQDVSVVHRKRFL